MFLEFLFLILLMLLACAGNVTRMVARSVRDLQPTLMSAQSFRLRHYEALGSIAFFFALSAISAWGVIAAERQSFSATGVALVAAATVLFVLIVAELARGIGHNHLDTLARPFLGDAAAFLPLMEPHDEAEQPEEKREEALEEMVEAGEKVGLIESGEREMISGIIRMDTTAVREIMLPRIDVVGIEVSSPIRTALDVMVNGSHSRVPVYEESLDHVVGLLYAKDLLKALRDNSMDVSLQSMLRPAHFIPESKPVDELLQELQQFKVHMAIVVDEYGGTAGIVTIEDILEEIVGEIQDEYDTAEEPQVERINENEGVFDARVNINQVNNTLGLNLPEESDTLGGLVYKRLQKMAKTGDEVRVDGVTISVLSVAGRRIKKVRVAKQVYDLDTSPQQGEPAADVESSEEAISTPTPISDAQPNQTVNDR